MADHDWFVTPMPLVEVCVKSLLNRVHYERKLKILDVGAGDGRWGYVARKLWPHAIIVGVEIRDVERDAEYRHAYDYWLHCDFLKLRAVPGDCPDVFDQVIGNPPFSLAQRLVIKALANTEYWGEVSFLLRLAFLEGQKRNRNFWPKYEAQHVDILPKRPTFRADGATDKTAYAFFHWAKTYEEPSTFGRLDYYG